MIVVTICHPVLCNGAFASHINEPCEPWSALRMVYQAGFQWSPCICPWLKNTSVVLFGCYCRAKSDIIIKSNLPWPGPEDWRPPGEDSGRPSCVTWGWLLPDQGTLPAAVSRIRFYTELSIINLICLSGSAVELARWVSCLPLHPASLMHTPYQFRLSSRLQVQSYLEAHSS